MDNIIQYLQKCFVPRDSTEFIIVENFQQEIFDNLRQVTVALIVLK